MGHGLWLLAKFATLWPCGLCSPRCVYFPVNHVEDTEIPWDTFYQLSSSVTHLSMSCQASKSFQIWNRFGTPGSQSFARHLSFPSMSNPPSLPHFIGVRCQQGFHIRRVFLHREPRRVTTLAAPWKRFAMKVEVENGWTSTQRINMWGMWIYCIVLSLHHEETMWCYGCRNEWSSED